MDFGKLMNTFKRDAAQMEFNLSVDCNIFTIQDGKLKVLLNKPFPEAMWMLPGGFMNKNEEATTAAIRVLKQRTGAEKPPNLHPNTNPQVNLILTMMMLGLNLPEVKMERVS